MKEKIKMPKSIAYIIGNEAAERFSFYGMRSILVTFLITNFFLKGNHLGAEEVAEAKANELVHYFISLVYLFPIVGAIAADWFFGRYKVILWVSIIYCLGHLMLALFENNFDGFYWGLILIAIGSGGIKPNVSANLGDQFDESKKKERTRAYELFYFSINTGSFLATLSIPILYKEWGASVAFAVPGVFMAIATFIFFLGRKHYVHEIPSGIPKNNFLSILFYKIKVRFKHKELTKESRNLLLKEKFGAQKMKDTEAILKVIRIFAFIPFFWALYDQNYSEWVIQARKMDVNWMGMEWIPEQIQAINAILILVFVPLFSLVLYPYLKKKKIKFTALNKLSLGFVLAAISFVFIALAQTKIDAGETPSISWQVIAYVFLTAGEVLISLTGLEYAYNQSPKSARSTIMAIWLLTTSLGNFLVSMVHHNIQSHGIFSQFRGANYFWLFCALGIITGIIFYFSTRRLNRTENQAI